MQEDGEVRLPDDDMVDGDLGDGMMKEACARRRIHQSFCLSENLLLRTQLLTGDLLGIPGLKTSHTHQVPGRNIPHLSSITEMSKEDLTVRLQEAAEVIDLLCCELDVTYRYLEGKYEALKILQGKAILEKATIHTKSLLQKSEDKAKALEKEVNSLQWELSFLQLQMKTSEQSWSIVVIRMLSENKALTESLEETESELQQLRAQNAALRREYLELLSLLSVRDQVLYQKTKPPYSPESDAHVLELAVLGACQCLGVNEVCPCSRNAAASRKQVVLLHQELDAQHSRREEALMVADAFRIAFEQQLKKRSEHLLLLAETSVYKAEGGSRSPLISVRQKLRSLLPSSVDVKRPEELLETLYKLMDLLNDKEEALAHQRKVSLMLAHSAKELQKKLSSDETRMEPQQPQQDSSENEENQENSSEIQGYQTCGSTGSEIRNPRAELQQEMSDALLQPGLERSPENRTELVRPNTSSQNISTIQSPRESETGTQIHQNPERH
ncbi:coiled-coil domain-containing protein 125 [Gouania willdenowi]|uniref:coiled-coil domain-containing protein 125 n=1 Tax=Gouania willdenowi TaxID=441366 RepID=UPI00105576B9|nr:coiled-coil domain-containing protein 125 [Gouania willdenowi]